MNNFAGAERRQRCSAAQVLAVVAGLRSTHLPGACRWPATKVRGGAATRDHALRSRSAPPRIFHKERSRGEPFEPLAREPGNEGLDRGP